jgi:hypothetical protein
MKLSELDYTLTTAKSRLAITEKIINDNIEDIYNGFQSGAVKGVASPLSESSYSGKQLDFLGSYILFADDQKKTTKGNKTIELKGRKDSFARKDNLSLDALLEDPLTDENNLHAIKKPIYLKPKPTISRTNDADIPTMTSLWEIIDHYQHIYDVARGTVVDETIPPQSSLEQYRLRHFLIELRKEQYYLKEIFKPVHFMGTMLHPSHWDCFDHRLEHINYENPLHVYSVLSEYAYYKQDAWEDLVGDMKFIIMDIENLIDHIKWDPLHYYILIRKIDKATNDQIAHEIQLRFGIKYNVNYISTMWKKNICTEIATRAQLEREWREKASLPEAWKKCSCCGGKKLRDHRFFVKKADSKDGLSARCKVCDKQKREEKKHGGRPHA